MLDGELAALAETGAGALVALMVGDGWAEVKAGFAALFARCRRSEPTAAEKVAGELEQARGKLVAARAARDSQAEASVRKEWHFQLCRLLEADPYAARLLADLMARSGHAVSSTTIADNTITGNTFHGPVSFNNGSGNSYNTYGTHGTHGTHGPTAAP